MNHTGIIIVFILMFCLLILFSFQDKINLNIPEENKLVGQVIIEKIENMENNSNNAVNTDIEKGNQYFCQHYSILEERLLRHGCLL